MIKKPMTFLCLAATLFVCQVHAQQQADGQTDWEAVLTQAKERAQGQSQQTQEEQRAQEEQDAQRLQSRKSDQEEAAKRPLSAEDQAILDAAKTRADGNRPNEAESGEPGDDEKFCGAVMCLSKGDSLPFMCKSHVDAYFEVRVYVKKTFKRVYDPARTAVKRDAKVIKECKWTPPKDRAKIAARYGMLYDSPFIFK